MHIFVETEIPGHACYHSPNIEPNRVILINYLIFIAVNIMNYKWFDQTLLNSCPIAVVSGTSADDQTWPCEALSKMRCKFLTFSNTNYTKV